MKDECGRMKDEGGGETDRIPSIACAVAVFARIFRAAKAKSKNSFFNHLPLEKGIHGAQDNIMV
jgi:hypothetical protein